MPNLDKHIKHHYQSKSLSQARLQTILSDANAQRHRRWWRVVPAVAATLVLVGLAFFYHQQEHAQLQQRVIAEIAMNHSKQLQVEVVTADYDSLQNRLDRLDFLVDAQAIPADLRLLGGRYCSIQGQLAAQLKLEHKKTGDVKTLYVTRLSDKLKSLASQTTTHNAMTIQLWQTSDCLFGLASTTQTTY